MKKLLSTNYTDWAVSIALLVLRVGMGVMMLPHGYGKLVHFAERKNSFMNFLGMGSTVSLSLSLFAEFFCALFVIVGLFTRFAVLPLVIGMSVAVFNAHDAQIFGDGETPALYLAGFIAILLIGPGKVSADKLMGK
ncbi:MAG TPA: DoxX family protein [Agriterribacter sp.]|nr:DoxX family protein [Chitinophagaceae bacterium]HRP31991.1 DoxX family protein [Agriterribacter sp.]